MNVWTRAQPQGLGPGPQPSGAGTGKRDAGGRGLTLVRKKHEEMETQGTGPRNAPGSVTRELRGRVARHGTPLILCVWFLKGLRAKEKAPSQP